jgi:hypothetical protein
MAQGVVFRAWGIAVLQARGVAGSICEGRSVGV